MFEKEIAKRLLGVSVIAALLLLVLAGMPAAVAPPAEGNVPGIGAPTGGNVCFVVVWGTPATYFGSIYWQNTMIGYKPADGGLVQPNAWSDCIYAILGQDSIVTITVTDFVGYAGDYYKLWVTTDPYLTYGWSLVGTTPRVNTSSHLVAPTFLPIWDGTGTTASSASFGVWLSAGVTYYFRVANIHFVTMTNSLDGPCGTTPLQLLTNGCSVTGISVSPYWSPAGFTIQFV